MEYLVIILLAYLSLSVFYNAVYSVSAQFKGRQTPSEYQRKDNRIAVIIPAYKEDSIIIETARKALIQDYNPNQYDVIVIADSLQPATIDQLRILPVVLVEVAFNKSTKAKAINQAFEQLNTKYDIAVILDADNEMHDDFLTKINHEYNAGYQAIQGHRVAKNKENSMAILDAISEEVNNNIYRKGHQNLGLSSALIGSGMAFDYELFKKEMNQINAIGGFDKALELSLLKSNIAIRYVEDAIVYDEKVSREEVFTNQRTRWIAAQIRYGISSIGDAIIHLIKKGNINYFDKSLQFLLPPRLILLGTLSVTGLVSGIIGGVMAWWSIVLLFTYVLSLMIATPRSFFNRHMFGACLKLPKTFWLMMVAFKGFRKAKTNFLHTPHQNIQS